MATLKDSDREKTILPSLVLLATQKERRSQRLTADNWFEARISLRNSYAEIALQNSALFIGTVIGAATELANANTLSKIEIPGGGRIFQATLFATLWLGATFILNSSFWGIMSSHAGKTPYNRTRAEELGAQALEDPISATNEFYELLIKHSHRRFEYWASHYVWACFLLAAALFFVGLYGPAIVSYSP